MALFGKLFEKKECSICGGEIGLLGNRKLEDGNLCKECAGKLSPWFDDRRHSTVEQIRQQLNYREENRRKLGQFRPAKSYGEDYELKVELENGVPKRFVVAQTDNYLEENADLIEFSQVTSFNIEIDEDEQEQQYRNSEGEMVSYRPPRYEYSYDFNAEIIVNSPYFDDIHFRLNGSTLTLETVVAGRPLPMHGSREFDPTLYPEYREYKALCDELEELFRSGMQGIPLAGTPVARPAPVSAPAPVAAAAAAAAWRCDSCGTENSGKFCQGCGAPQPVQGAGWTCSCGTVNTGRFCAECGGKKPAGIPQYKCDKCGWQPADPTQAPRFCPECGDPFDCGDIV